MRQPRRIATWRGRDLRLTPPFPCGCCLIQVTYKIPDVTGKEKHTYAGKHTLVVGAGHSAITTVHHLLALKAIEPDTRITWITRKKRPLLGAAPSSSCFFSLFSSSPSTSCPSHSSCLLLVLVLVLLLLLVFFSSFSFSFFFFSSSFSSSFFFSFFFFFSSFLLMMAPRRHLEGLDALVAPGTKQRLPLLTAVVMFLLLPPPCSVGGRPAPGEAKAVHDGKRARCCHR